MGEPCDAADRSLPDDLVVGDWDTAARVAELLEVVQSYARLEFSGTAPVGDAGDDLDALAAGINMLGEELEAAHRGFEQRVAERTAELSEIAERLEAEVAVRRRTEAELAQSNTGLTASVERLEWLDTRIGHLTRMSNLLQVVDDREEAYAILGRFAPEIFTGADGGMSVLTPTGETLERVSSWGDDPTPPTIAATGCRAVRDGTLHRVQAPDDTRCEHLPAGPLDQALCVPVTAQGQRLGVLQLRWGRPSAPSGQMGDLRSPSPGEYERLAVAAGEQFGLSLANLELRAELRSQSIRDALTGLYNRRYLDETLGRALRQATREAASVSVLMLDIDRFKDFNDAYGHAAGDAALVEVAGLLRANLRDEDVACRYGGEELAVVMSGVDLPDAARRAEQIRVAIAGRSFTWNGRSAGSVTVSVGVATYPDHAHDPDGLFRAADRALYDAKHRGRNRVETA